VPAGTLQQFPYDGFAEGSNWVDAFIASDIERRAR
jgi:hypothetical protein